MKRALLVGIDEYDNFGSLAGCGNDVDALNPLFSRNEDDTPNFDAQTRTSSTGGVERDPLLKDITALLGPGADVALFYFAGHGSGTESDVALVSRDGTEGTPGIRFSELLTVVATSPVTEIVIVLDCCFAGAAGGIPELATTTTALRSGVSILAASRRDQTAAETEEGRGLFSTFLEGALDGGAADVLGKVTVAGLYSYLDESFGAWDQRPAFKANVDRLHELRRCKPAVPLDQLRQITRFFPAADTVMALDPSFEPEAEPRNPENEASFAILQKYRAAKLLEPVDTEHLYFAAMENKGCRLTPLGRHYWQVAHEGRL